MIRLAVDFNAIQDGAVRALTQHASSPLREGDRVWMTDEEEHAAEGVVSRLDGDLVYVEIDWDTWGPIYEVAQGTHDGSASETIWPQRTSTDWSVAADTPLVVAI
jgi:hypothetical protein